eukprot:4016414-Amphidinium_carterae.1
MAIPNVSSAPPSKRSVVLKIYSPSTLPTKIITYSDDRCNAHVSEVDNDKIPPIDWNVDGTPELETELKA